MAAQVKPGVTNVTVVPLVFAYNSPFMTVMIQGKNFPLQLDLGGTTGEVFLDLKILKRLKGVRKTHKFNRGQNAAGERHIDRTYILPQMTIGNFVFSNVMADEFNDWGFDPTKPKQVKQSTPEIFKSGLVGLKLFKNLRIILDYPHSRMLLMKGDASSPKEYEIDKWHKFQFDLIEGSITTRGKLDSQQQVFVWDTGWPTMFVKSSHASKIKAFRKKSEEGTPIQVSLELENRQYGSWPFVVADASSLPGTAVIGHPFFMTHQIYIDFVHKIIAIH